MKSRTERQAQKIFQEAVRGGQPDLFAVLALMSRSAIGLEVELPSTCQCGAHTAAVCSGTEPYPGELKCSKCGRHRGWVSDKTFRFLSGTIDRFGKPTEPVIVRASANGQ
jgi:hypothetical protein